MTQSMHGLAPRSAYHLQAVTARVLTPNYVRLRADGSYLTGCGVALATMGALERLRQGPTPLPPGYVAPQELFDIGGTVQVILLALPSVAVLATACLVATLVGQKPALDFARRYAMPLICLSIALDVVLNPAYEIGEAFATMLRPLWNKERALRCRGS